MCEHTVLKCSNCNDAHKANSSECAVFKALKSHLSSTDSLAMNKEISSTTYSFLNTEQEKSRLQIFQHNCNRVSTRISSEKIRYYSISRAMNWVRKYHSLTFSLYKYNTSYRTQIKSDNFYLKGKLQLKVHTKIRYINR